jgi:phosphatidylserine/phosphatidylglycerophosphate/cardiolipin synthase-like enzyme
MSSFLAFIPTPELEKQDSELTSGRASPCTGNICLNEAMPNPNGYDDALWPNGEWFELTNTGTSNIDISGWYANNKNSKQITFDSASIVGYNSSNSATWTIAPGDYLIIARNGSANFYLTNTAETLELFDSSSSKQDEASWTTASSGASYVEDPADAYADWITAAGPTPGSNNSGASGPTYFASDLIISEVMPNPWPSADNETWPGGEWVEVYNNGNSDFDVSGWNLTDSAGNSISLDQYHMIGYDSSVPSTWLIEAGGYRIVAVNSTASYGVLNNGQEELFLKWPNGTISEKVTWNNAYSGMSLNKNAMGLMETSVFPTAGMENSQPIASIINASSNISFNEVLPNATADGNIYASGGEWLELFNSGNSDLDLSGWSIKDGMGNITSLNGSLVNSGTTILVDGYRIVEFTAGTRLWEDWNYLTLFNPSGEIVDVLHWDANHGENNSLISQPDFTLPWQPSPFNTPGEQNPSTGISNETLVIINEVMPNPSGADTSAWPGGEWVELWNIGNDSIDLDGWKLQAGGNKNYALTSERILNKENTSIEPGEFLVVFMNGSSSFYLRNTNGDSVSLHNADGDSMHTILWDINITEGESLVRPPPQSGTGYWLSSLWPTPGSENPSFGGYTGPTTILMNEVLPHCYDDSVSPVDDWVELYNSGTEAVNLSRFSLVASDGDTIVIRDDKIWNGSTGNITILQAGEYAVILGPTNFALGYGDSIDLLDPNGNYLQSMSWTTTVDCRTVGPDLDDANAEWKVMLWPTPGELNPDPANYDFDAEVLFTRLMVEETSYSDRNNEFFELTNVGEKTVDLTNYIVRRTKLAGDPYDGKFSSLFLQSGESIVLTPDATHLAEDSGMQVVQANTVMDNTVFLTNSGASLQLISPTNEVIDSLVYGNADPAIEGWSGASLSKPNGSSDGHIYIRGDGCNNHLDTNTSEDWKMRWSRIGASQNCNVPTFSTTGSITPTISPAGSLAQIIQWLDSAQTSIHVHIYELHSPEISFALRQAAQRGVEVTVVLDEGDYWWEDNALRWQRGHASDLAAAGATVYWFGEPSDSDAPAGPYAFLHSKVAVVDDSSTWIGSGNWKRSTMPVDGQAGNVDWGVIIEAPDVAMQVLERISWDENPANSHVKLHDPLSPSQGTPNGWATPTQADDPPTLPTNTLTTTGVVEGRLLTCPDDCMEGLAWLIDEADEELLLSLQNLDMDWYWGWGVSPLWQSLENAAQRGVKIRLIINGYYWDDEIQDAVNTFNHEWNETNGWDTSAIIMSSSDSITKLHNKGVIVDGELTLFSSINFGASAIIRNREMGVVIDSVEIAEFMRTSWLEDWNRVDDTTDSDGDGLPDGWELANGLNRTNANSPAGVYGEEMMDNDGDNLSNLYEYLYDSNPFSLDTDGDCIPDEIEIIISISLSSGASQDLVNQTIRNAMRSTDVDGDGINDGIFWNCGEGIAQDSDFDGVEDELDNCPDTSIGHSVDSDGCSDEQLSNNDADEDGVEDVLDNCPDTLITEVALGWGGNYVAEESYRGCSPTQLDADSDGIFNDRDECPETPASLQVNIDGCSAEQLTEKAKSQSNEEEKGSAGMVFTIIMIISGIGLSGWLLANMLKNKGSLEDFEYTDTEIPSNLGLMPILDGSSGPVLDGSTTPTVDLSLFPGWEEATVQTYLNQGWTIEQLKEWYDSAKK